jgi:hypothetical protein
VVGVAAFVALTGAARASSQSVGAGMDSATAAAIDRIVARVNAEGLPGEAVRAKALEGSSRGVPGDRVVRVVAAYADTLRVARDVLGASGAATPGEQDLVAAAGVLSAGVSRAAATSLAVAARARTAQRAAIVPYVVTADLVARGVPPDSAAVAVGGAVRRGASDAKLWRLREAIAHDIADGAPPLEAAMLRTGTGPARPPMPPASSMPPGPP